MIQHSRAAENGSFITRRLGGCWMPAFAGMTREGLAQFDRNQRQRQCDATWRTIGRQRACSLRMNSAVSAEERAPIFVFSVSAILNVVPQLILNVRPAAFASLWAWRLRVAERARSIVRPFIGLCADRARPWPSVSLYAVVVRAGFRLRDRRSGNTSRKCSASSSENPSA